MIFLSCCLCIYLFLLFCSYYFVCVCVCVFLINLLLFSWEIINNWKSVKCKSGECIRCYCQYNALYMWHSLMIKFIVIGSLVKKCLMVFIHLTVTKLPDSSYSFFWGVNLHAFKWPGTIIFTVLYKTSIIMNRGYKIVIK